MIWKQASNENIGNMWNRNDSLHELSLKVKDCNDDIVMN